MTPLMYAVKDNRTSLVERMLELGSDVTARNNVSNQIEWFPIDFQSSFTILLQNVASIKQNLY